MRVYTGAMPENARHCTNARRAARSPTGNHDAALGPSGLGQRTIPELEAFGRALRRLRAPASGGLRS